MIKKERISYQPPEFCQHDLRVVTLGGTPGFGDSTPVNTEPPTNSFGEDSFDEWDDEHDGFGGNGI